MTPEGSQSSEELLNSEEILSAAPSSSSSSNVQIRVKDVSEINSNEAEANPSPPTKRKLPSWILAGSQEQDSDSNKKRKTAAKQVQYPSTSSAVDNKPESTVTPSTSGSNVQPDNDETSLTNVSNGEAGKIAETGAENGEVTECYEKNVNGEACSSGQADETTEADGKDKLESGVKPPSSSDGASTSNGQSSSSPLTAVKTEPVDKEDNEVVGHITPTSPRDIKPAVKVEKEEATSSTSRPTCKFGIRCYRQNPLHRREEAHPGDKDYQRPNFPTPPIGTPDCPYGDLCYRRNPMHFQHYNHPPSTDFDQNWKNYIMRLRQRKPPATVPDSSYSDLSDDEDDFNVDGSDDEFIPNDGDGDDDDDFL